MKRVVLPVLVTVCLVLAGCGGKTTNPSTPDAGGGGGFDSPQAAFDAFQAAASKGDMKAALAATTVETQQAFAGTMVFGLSLVGAFDQEKGKEIEAIFEKHGLSEDAMSEPPPGLSEDAGPAEAMRAIGAMIKDPAAFIDEAFAVMADSEGSPMDEFVNGEMKDLVVDGDQATAIVLADGEETPIEFKKQADGWRLHMPEDEFNGGSSMDGNMRFGPGGGDEFDFHYDEPDELPPPEAITKAEFDQAWMTSLDVDGQPAGQVLADLASQCGMTLFDQPDFAEKLDQEVTLKLENVSRLQAIEAVCEQLGIYPRYHLKTLGFGEGTRPLPAAFAGPFLIAVSDLQDESPYPTGRLELQFVAAGIPTAMASRLVELQGVSQEESADSLTLNLGEVTGGGMSLLKTGMGGSPTQGSHATVTFRQIHQLKNLLRSVESIDPIEGKLSWSFPSKTKVVKLTDLKTDATITEGDLTVKLGSVSLDEDSQFSIEASGVEDLSVVVVGIDADGNPLQNNFTNSFSFGGSTQLDLSTRGKPAALELRIAEDSERVSYDFSLASIPLENHSQMPEQIEELAIDGDVPLTLEFVEIAGSDDFRTVEFKITNHTNKPIRHAQFSLDYQDGSGASLKEGNSMDVGNPILVETGESTTIELNAFFMPEGTEKVAGKVTSIEFADATTWGEQF